MEQLVYNILYGAGAGAAFAGLAYAKQAVGEDPEKFKLFKAIPTVILGAGIGGMLAMAGTPVSEESVMVQVGVYGFMTVVIESGIKAIYRAFNKPYPL